MLGGYGEGAHFKGLGRFRIGSVRGILDDLIRLYGRPARVRVDNGPELTAEGS